MSKNTMIKIGGKEYPCRVTMGAMLRFNEMTGHDVSKMESSSMADTTKFLWCCIKSACKVDAIEVEMDFETFADMLSLDDISEFYSGMDVSDEKKNKG